MIGGTIHGVVLNDRLQIDALRDALQEPPYGAPPVAPVVYIKPRTCVSVHGAPVIVPHDLDAVELAATVALLFGHRVDSPVAAALALDVCEAHDSYYRPAIRERCRDGFLPLGDFASYSGDMVAGGDIVTVIDGVERHRWSLDRLVRGVPSLIEELSAFMSFAPGDVLLVGLPGDAPRAGAGSRIAVTHPALPPLSTRLTAEASA